MVRSNEQLNLEVQEEKERENDTIQQQGEKWVSVLQSVFELDFIRTLHPTIEELIIFDKKHGRNISNLIIVLHKSPITGIEYALGDRIKNICFEKRMFGLYVKQTKYLDLDLKKLLHMIEYYERITPDNTIRRIIENSKKLESFIISYTDAGYDIDITYSDQFDYAVITFTH